MIHSLVDKPRVIIDPTSRWKIGWNIFIAALVVVSAFDIPYRLVFHANIFNLGYWIITLFFCVDFGMNFVTAVYHRHTWITDSKAIFSNYLKTWMIPDAIATLPIGPVILLFLGTTSLNTESGFALYILQGTVLFRLIYLVKLGRIFKTIENALNINPSIMRLISLGFLFFLVAHYLALGWVSIGAAAATDLDYKLIQNLSDPVPNFARYLRALYFTTTTMATIGYGDISPHKDNLLELGFTIVEQIVGVGMYGYIIGNVSTMLANLDVARAAFQRRMEEINAYMRSQKLPPAMQAKIRNYYDYMWDKRQSTGEESTLEKLPKSLAMEVQLFLNREILEKVPFFKDAEEVFIREIIANLKPLIFMPGDFIVRKGEYGDTMYFISSGAVEVLINEDTVVAKLQAGSNFGEMALVHGGARNASVRAAEYCDAYELSKAAFDRLRQLYPAFDKRVVEIVEERDRQNKAKA
jgi:voltage-gated potassium channel